MRPAWFTRRRSRILVRTALLSWLVTSVTLLVFVGVIIPEQRRTFLENLNSKAHGVAISFQDVAATAVVNEDWATVVGHCLQVLEGDAAIDHLVLTRNDGFSLVHELQGKRWYPETNAPPEWRPDRREVTSGIQVAPVFQRRVFAYAFPFDYKGIQWGWITIGLSLKSYDTSVAAAYRRTAVLAAVCIVFSLVASVMYANQLVRPILSLRSVVQRVARGDLSVRAAIHTGDEIQDLAQSVNTMTSTLQQRDQILQSVRVAAQRFLVAGDWRSAIPEVLARLGQAADVSRAYVFENREVAGGVASSSQQFEWCAPGCAAEIGNPGLQDFRWTGRQLATWADRLRRGEILAAHTDQLDPAERAFLAAQSIQALLLIPIRVEGRWWGFLGLDECRHDRTWSEAEMDSLRTAADMFSAAIERQRAQDALVEAKNHLERRVQERTRELEEQVEAKERAHAALAEAQQRLVDASRRAGMAEVATGVLHNVGNVLNSVNVSVNLLQDRLNKSKIDSVRRVAGLLQEHRGDLADYLTQDPRGRLVPEFLGKLSDHLAHEQGQMLGELQSLTGNVEHIKEIVAMQQSYARVSGVLEPLAAAQLAEDALRINEAGLKRHGIRVERCFDPVPLVLVDKHKALQILINLLRNAKQALKEASVSDKCLGVAVRSASATTVQLVVRDNGIGIPPEHLTKIFSHGFTTKREGHGFGLHSGALAALEMGGRLVAASDGVGCGAEFVLELPVAVNAEGVLCQTTK